MNKAHFNLVPISLSPFVSFFQGMGVFFRGAKYILERPRLWLLVLIPLVINIILFSALLFWGYSAFSGMIKSQISQWEDPAWYLKGLAIMARIFFWLLSLIAVYLIFTPSALIIASPFSDLLAESAEKECGFVVREEKPFLRKILWEAMFAIRAEIKRMAFFLSVFIILFPANFIPIIGSVVYVIMSFIWSCFGFAFEFTGFATDRRHIRLKEKLKFLKRHLSFFMGFGFLTTILFMVPFLNVFAVSLSAISGSIAFCSAKEKGDVGGG